ncbi:PREDICTED: homeobox protein DLX-1 [Hipposideros armiger]|uniref:Homeobox protein DLX-1 n=1 Tax=Hipposideros armiger TaxID=186990 RepID=A0A8B7SG53_HIPAR|nr:PREDICTED: homeobox protein DLX-1 [Hipposideros armiger]
MRAGPREQRRRRGGRVKTQRPPKGKQRRERETHTQTPREEMTMTTMPESLNSPVSGKAVFMEFGPPNQQMSPSPMSHGHYSMHCLHSAGHSQPDGAYSSASSFSRPLGYPYVNSVSSHASSPYISSVQSYPGSASLAQSRLEDPGQNLVPEQALQVQEADEAGWGGSGG